MNDAKPPLPTDEVNDDTPTTDQAVEAPASPAPPVPPAEPTPSPPPTAPAAPAPRRGYGDPLDKSPGLALFLSILFPGLGHIYVGAYERALMIIGGIGVSIWAMVHSDGRLWPLAFVIAFAYFFSLFDAFREAQIVNLLAADQELPKPRPRGEGRLVFGVFLTVVAAVVLADNLDLFDLDWLYDWWPAIVLLIGLYFIGSWFWEKVNSSGRPEDSSFDDSDY
jgi:hypothetical protein